MPPASLGLQDQAFSVRRPLAETQPVEASSIVAGFESSIKARFKSG